MSFTNNTYSSWRTDERTMTTNDRVTLLLMAAAIAARPNPRIPANVRLASALSWVRMAKAVAAGM